MNDKYTPPCPHYRKCGGCQLQNLPYDEQLLFKQRMAVSLLGEFGPAQILLDEVTGLLLMVNKDSTLCATAQGFDAKLAGATKQIQYPRSGNLKLYNAE